MRVEDIEFYTGVKDIQISYFCYKTQELTSYVNNEKKVYNLKIVGKLMSFPPLYYFQVTWLYFYSLQ